MNHSDICVIIWARLKANNHTKNLYFLRLLTEVINVKWYTFAPLHEKSQATDDWMTDAGENQETGHLPNPCPVLFIYFVIVCLQCSFLLPPSTQKPMNLTSLCTCHLNPYDPAQFDCNLHLVYCKILCHVPCSYCCRKSKRWFWRGQILKSMPTNISVAPCKPGLHLSTTKPMHT